MPTESQKLEVSSIMLNTNRVLVVLLNISTALWLNGLVCNIFSITKRRFASGWHLRPVNKRGLSQSHLRHFQPWSSSSRLSSTCCISHVTRRDQLYLTFPAAQKIDQNSPTFTQSRDSSEIFVWQQSKPSHSSRRNQRMNSIVNQSIARAMVSRGGTQETEESNEIIANGNTNTTPEEVISNSSEGDKDGNDEEVASDGEDDMQKLRKVWSSIPAVPSIQWPFEPEDLSTPISSNLSTSNKPTKAIILMDGFSPYHGQYISHMARHVYGAVVIYVLSDFFTRYLFQVEGREGHLSSRLPDFEDGDEVERWKSLLVTPSSVSSQQVEKEISKMPSSLQIRGIYCESDSGLNDAENLGVALGLYPQCHDGVNEARRNKYLMNEVLKENGLDVVQQRLCGSAEEAVDFATELGLVKVTHDADGGLDRKGSGKETPIVVKPLRGVASDDVHLCRDLSSVETAFRKIYNSPIFGSTTTSSKSSTIRNSDDSSKDTNKSGENIESKQRGRHDKVLVQEFATGTEYAIDVVCKNGEKKVAALWKYDKRSVNGAPFVYFGTELVGFGGVGGDSEDENDMERAVCNYVFQALEALGIRWGLHHVEVIAERMSNTAKEPDSNDQIRVRLVEVNCRQHNTDFAPLCDACIGYNALDMVLAAYLGDDHNNQRSPENMSDPTLQWESIPTLPSLRARGLIVHYVSHVSGRISCINHHVLEEMELLPSVMDMHIYPQFLEIGNMIEKTVDIRSDVGWAHLMNDDEEEFRNDYGRLVDLMKDVFEVDEENVDEAKNE